MNNWEIKKISEIATIKGGKRLPKGYILQKENNGHPYITVSDMKENGIILDNIKFVPLEILDKIKNYKIYLNEIYISVAGTIGNVGIVPKELDGANLTENADKFTNIKINQLYFLYFLKSQFFQNNITNIKTMSAQPKLAIQRLEKISIPVPPLEEQEKIVSILSKQDEVIEKLEKLIELKVRQKKGLMQRLLSGKLRLKGFSGEWKEDIMQSIILIFKKTKHNSSDGKNNGKYPFFINNSESFLKFLDEFDYDDECIIANTGGNAFFDYYNGKFSASSDCFVFSSKINTLFLYYFLKSIEKTVNIVGFAGSGIKHLNKKWFYKLKILIPPTIEEQSAIASILSKCDEEIELLKKKLGLYRGQKKWLMEKLLNGEIRV